MTTNDLSGELAETAETTIVRALIEGVTGVEEREHLQDLLGYELRKLRGCGEATHENKLLCATGVLRYRVERAIGFSDQKSITAHELLDAALACVDWTTLAQELLDAQG